AVVENVLQRAAEMAQIILQLNDYVKTNVPARAALEHYFLDGDEYSLLEVMREIELEALVASGDASDGV
ncbi:MAG: hypothetical protein ACWGQW_21960, partial [bacterium]